MGEDATTDRTGGRRRIGRIALGDIIHRSARRFGSRTAVFDGSRTISFEALNASGNRFAHWLCGLQLPPGTCIGMLCNNSVAMIAAFTGIQKAGLVWVPVNTGLAPPAIDFILGHADIGHLVIDGDLLAQPVIAEMIAARGIACIVVGAGASAPLPASTIAFADAAAGQPDTLPEVDIGSDDLCQVMYTSGTTGKQKGVMHSHASVYAGVMSNVAEFGANRTDVASGIFPLFHVTQHCIALTFWAVGGAIDLRRGFDVDAVLAAIQEARISVMVALPIMYRAILDHPRRKDFDLSSLRLCIYAMAPMAQPMLLRLIEEICPNFALCSGQTEMYPATTMFKPEEQLRRFGPYWGDSRVVNETAIMDERGNLLPRGEVGEIVHRGPNAMLGYFRDSEATREAQAFGWHHTGDLGTFDPDGQLLFIDRKKDMIKSGGENVASVKIEETLLAHPSVQNAAVVGLPHPEWGEAVSAFVTLKPGKEADAAEIAAHCRQSLGGFQVPKLVKILDAMPVTATGKLRKVELRQQFSEHFVKAGA